MASEATLEAAPAFAEQDQDEQLLAAYEDEGIKTVRLSRKTKRCVDEGWQNNRVSSKAMSVWVETGGNVGAQMGAVSGWLCTVDPDCPETRTLAPRFLPATLKVAKGDEDPSLYFYRSPFLGFAQFADLNGEVLMDLKASADGAGHQVTIPPSVHPGKGPYRWDGGTFDPEAIAEVRAEKLRRDVGRLAVTALVARNLPEGGRHNLAMAIAGFMLRNGETPEDVLEILTAAWELNFAPVEALRDLERIVRDTAAKLESDTPVTGGPTLERMIPGLSRKIAEFLAWQNASFGEGRRSYTRTDQGNAERLVDRHGDDLLYDHVRGRWLVYDGKRWKVDDTGQVVRFAKATARSIYAEAAEAAGEQEAKEIAKWAASSHSESKIKSMIALARSEPGIHVTSDQLDQDLWLLNVENGTIDLKSGELRPHRREDLITKLAPVHYDPYAEAPTWEAFQNRITDGNQDLVKFKQRIYGYGLTGDVSEQKLFFTYGPGANGKSTEVNTILDMMGDYGQQAAPELLTVKGSSHPTELADLKGARLVASIEVEEGKHLAESLVKQMTGGDRIKARFMRQDFFEFEPTHKVLLVANHKPVVRGTDHAIWRRIKMIPFGVTIPKAEQDPKLPERLKEELPGILAWAVRGCLEWQREGLGEPEEVREATEEYRSEMDVLAEFLDERCETKPEARASATELYREYRFWCMSNEEPVEPRREFVRRLEERGLKRRRSGSDGTFEWRGVTLRSRSGLGVGVY